jgi:predicted RNA-binding protein with TRAM domain
MTCLYVILFWMYKCGYANCAICKNAIKNSEHWGHIRLHHGHENHGPPPPLPQTSFENRQQQHQSNSRSNNKKFGRGFADAIQLQVGKGYEVDTTQIGGYGDGIARIQDCVIFIKGGHIREKVRIIITETRSRFAIARTA